MFGGKIKGMQGEAPHTYCQIWWWVIDVLEIFCCQWSRRTIEDQLIKKARKSWQKMALFGI